MKKISNLFTGLLFIILIGLSNNSFSQQITPAELLNCNTYPTKDYQLNGLVDDFVRHNREFTLRMTTIHQNLSLERRQIAESYLMNSDTVLFNEFPEFNDQELIDKRSQIRSDYLTVWSMHQNLYPGFDNSQRQQAIREIIQCATVKDEIQRQGEQNRLIDPCETERINCIISVGAQAAAMHVACASLHLTIFGGIICHGGAFAYQWAAGNNCNIVARRCREANSQ